jgi:hypothetical protein
MGNGLPLTSEGLAVLIIDALVDAGLVERACFEAALTIATGEIDVRKSMGDYAEQSGIAHPTKGGNPDRAG